MPIRTHAEWPYENPLVVVGFPSQGLVGAIAASYLVPRLEMKLVASLDSPHLPPVASVRGGRAVGPIQVYASTERCLDDRCDQLVVIRADAAPDPNHANEIAGEILEFAEEVDAALVVSLEGARRLDDEAVHALPNLPAEVDITHLGAEKAPDGTIGGMSAALLARGNHRDQGVLCLYTAATGPRQRGDGGQPSTQGGGQAQGGGGQAQGQGQDQGQRQGNVPDHEAAARLVGVVDTLVPGIRLDPDHLAQKAQNLEDRLRSNMRDQQRTIEEIQDVSSMMYS